MSIETRIDNLKEYILKLNTRKNEYAKTKLSNRVSVIEEKELLAKLIEAISEIREISRLTGVNEGVSIDETTFLKIKLLNDSVKNLKQELMEIIETPCDKMKKKLKN